MARGYGTATPGSESGSGTARNGASRAGETLSDTREAMERALGVADRGAGGGAGRFASQAPGEFPRSMIMRALADPKRRWAWALGIGAAVVLLPRVLPLRNVAPLIAAWSALRSASAAQRRDPD